MKSKYTVMKDKPREFFRLIPQTGVVHRFCLDDPKHNAIWDMAVSPEGRVFFSVCGESYEPLYARLYEFDRKNKTFIRHMELEKQILQNPNGLRTSKFHTALSFMGDGKILTATHTTSPAPGHPTWMPYEYAEHPYESYPGSDLLIYDYEKKECRGLGRFSPHDTVYGATYDPKNGDYFAITWMRGTGYVYNVRTGEIRCLGQVSDTHTSRTFLCSDGHIYGSTYTGAMFRYNTDLRDIEWLGVSASGLIRHAREMDGKLYFITGPCGVPGRSDMLYAYDFVSREITEIGRPVPSAEPVDENVSAYCNAYGIAFDSKKRLWYGCMIFAEGHTFIGARLYMWDFLNGKEPVDCGFLGTPERTISVTAELHIVDDMLYVSDGNHISDCPTPSGILEIDLNTFAAALDTEERLMSHDYMNYIAYQAEAREFYPKDDFDECLARYDEYYDRIVVKFRTDMAKNAYRHAFAHASGISMWETLGRGKAAVQKLEWQANDRVIAYVGEDGTKKVECVIDANGDASILSCTDCAPVKNNGLRVQIPDVKLPHVPGRQYLAKAKASVQLKNGDILVGTQDTMLARIRNGKVFSLGAVCTAGGVHSMDITPDGKVYGVAGHPLGVGQLFTYTEEEGVTLLGLIPEVLSACGRNAAIFRPTTASVSPDGKYLAVGGEDEMGGIVVLKL